MPTAGRQEAATGRTLPSRGRPVREKQASCPNCDTVLTAHYEPDEAEGLWYECPICGLRVAAEGFRSVEAADEVLHRRSVAH